MRRTTVWMLLFPVALALLATSAAAASSDLTVRMPDPPTSDPGEIVEQTIRVIYEYHGSGSSSGEVKVDLSTSVEGPATVGVGPNPLTIDVDDSQQRGTGTVTLSIRMYSDAGAFEEARVQVSFQARSSGSVEASERVVKETFPRADYVPDLRLVAPEGPIQISTTRITPVDLQVINAGNGITRYQLREVAAPDHVETVFQGALEVAPNSASDPATTTVRIFQGADQAQAGEVRIRAHYNYHVRGNLSHRTSVVAIPVEPTGSDGLPGIAAVGTAAALAAASLVLARTWRR